MIARPPITAVSTRLALKLLALLALSSFFAFSPILRAQTTTPPKRVLVLYWDNKDFPGNVMFDSSFKSVLASSKSGEIEYYPEYMEITRFPGQDQNFFKEYLRQKYADRPIDVVVASADFPLNFLIQHRAELFPKSPIVFVANAAPSPEVIAAGAGMTGVLHQSTHKETLELALKLQPDTKQVFVISGTPEHDKRYETLSRQELSSLSNRVEINYLTDLPLLDLIGKTASLPANSVVLYAWQQSSDEQGKPLETFETLSRISPTSSAPIYSVHSLNLGRGIVGGYLQGPEHNGAKTADLVLRILNGTRAQDIPVGPTTVVPMFDWRQLRRWGISETSLPAGSVVSFRQFGFWELYKWRVIAAISLILLQSMLIAILLIERQRRRRAVLHQQRLDQVARETHRRLGEIVANVPGIVWETMIDPKTNQRRTTFISDHVEKMLGYTAAEWLAAPPGFGLSLVVDDDREKAVAESERVVETGEDGFSEFRWRTKDGRIIWTDNYLSPVVDGDQNIIGLRGVAIDITDRKQAEETVKATTEKDRAILEAVPDLMFLHTRDGVYLDYHCMDVRHLSVPPEKFLGRNVREILPSHLAEKLVAGFQHAGKNGGPYLFEYEMAVNGSDRWYEARMVPSGANVLTLVRDVTERKTAEDALRKSEATLAAELADTKALQNISSKLLRGDRADELYGQILDAAMALMKSDTASMQIVNQNELRLLAWRGFHPESVKFWECVKVSSHSTCGEALRNHQRIVVRDVENCDFLAGTDDLAEYQRSDLRAIQSTPLISRNGRLVGMISTHWHEPHQPAERELSLLDVIARQAADLIERKKAIDALRESEERFRLAQNAALVGSWEWDVRTGESAWSDMLWELLGLEPDDVPITVDRFVSMIHPDDREHVWQRVNETLNNGHDVYDDEFRVVHPDGKVLWLSSKGRIIRSADGQAERMIGVNIDINTRKLAEESAREAQQKDAAILNAIPDLMFLQTRDGVYLDYHCSNPKDLLVPPEVFIGKNMRDVLPVELGAQFFAGFQRAIDTGELQLIEYELPLNGEPRWFEGRIVCSGDNIISVVRDITDRVLNAEAIRKNEAQLSGIISSAMDGIITVDEQQQIVLLNESAERIFGWKASEAVGQPLNKLIPERFRSSHKMHLQGFSEKSVTRRMMGERGAELCGLKRSGEEFPMEASISQIELNGHRFFTVILRDITDRRLAEAALKESEFNYRSIFNAANDAIFVIDFINGKILDVNERMCDLYGCTPEQASALWTAELSSNETPYTEHEAAAFIQAAARGLPQVFEWRAKKLNGELFWVEVNLRHLWLRGKECLLAVVRDITERKDAEEQLAASHEQVTEILESIGDAFYSLDNEMRFTYLNRKSEEYWGIGREDLLGKSFLDVFPDAVGTYSYHQCMRAIKEGKPVNFEAVSPIINRWVDASVYPSPTGLSVYFRDVTERRQALDHLRESEEKFGKAFRANPQPMSITVLATGQYLDVNESFVQTSGYSREELIGYNSLELNIWGSPEHRAEFIEKLNGGGSVDNIETRLRAKDGSFRTLLSSAETLDIAGQQCLLMASSDITERKLAQQALQESEARFRNMADTAPVMIWVSGTDKGCTYANQQWLDFTGRSMEQELGYGWTSGVHPSDYDGCLKMYEAAFNSHEPFRMEFRLCRADGAYRWVFASGTPRLSPGGKFLGYIGTCLDITDRKESEAALVFAHEALENAYAEVNRLKTQLQEENIYLQEEIKLQQNFGEIVGASDALKYVLFKIEQVAPTDSTVLITGETGTGKELVARAIHIASTRRDRPMVKVNCAALSASLIESELFGHEKGAFTGALARKIGRFELAEKGTIFLDEIGELPLELQVKLLRVIQEGEFERLGSSKTVKVDVRIIAATNRNLKDQVNRGLFREDLWYRLNVFPITVPPLRQRRDDIPMLIEHFGKTFARKLGKEINSIAPATINALRNYSWPGNVRELANVIERAVINAHGPVLRVHEQLRPVNGEASQEVNRSLEEVERDYIIRVLEDRGWRIEGPHGAAHVLGMNPSTLRTRMGKLGISKTNQTAAGNGKK
jgi:PAS domain S-box-containing protein